MKIANFNLQTDGIFIVAELSANHNGSLENAKKTIKEAAKTGANAIKLQTYTADTLTLDCDNKYFRIDNGSLWDGDTFYKLYQKAYTPWEWHEELFHVAKEEGLVCFSSPFDKSAVDLLESLNTPAYKIASFEIQDIGLIQYAASKMKPMILSTGIAELEDIELAIKSIKEMGNEEIILLKCTSAYPASLEEMNLKTITDMQSRFKLPIGLSDHTLGISVPVASAALGACVIEKHFIADRAIGGADASFSLEPQAFKQMVDAVRDVEKAMGKVEYNLSDKIKKNRIFARSLFISEDVEEGELITEKNVRSIRPAHGLHPKYLNDILGKTFTCKAEKGTPLDWSYIK